MSPPVAEVWSNFRGVCVVWWVEGAFLFSDAPPLSPRCQVPVEKKTWHRHLPDKRKLVFAAENMAVQPEGRSGGIVVKKREITTNSACFMANSESQFIHGRTASAAALLHLHAHRSCVFLGATCGHQTHVMHFNDTALYCLFAINGDMQTAA